MLTVSESVTGPYGPGNPIPAASTNSRLVYTYTAAQDVEGILTAIDMSGGAVRLTIPTGWTVPKNMVTVTDDDTNLYLAGALIAGAEDASPATVITATPLATADPDNRRVTVVGGDNITQIEVALDASWAAPRAAGRALIITFVNAIAPAPARLTFPPATSANEQDPPVATYEFTMRSKAKDGVFRRLKPTTATPNPQKPVTVGNVEDGIGTAAITVSGNSDNKIYQGEEDKTIEIVFTATGPMYDVDTDRSGDAGGSDDIDATIQITIPSFLTPPQEDTRDRSGFH